MYNKERLKLAQKRRCWGNSCGGSLGGSPGLATPHGPQTGFLLGLRSHPTLLVDRPECEELRTCSARRACEDRETQQLHWKEQQGSSLRKSRKEECHLGTLLHRPIVSDSLPQSSPTAPQDLLDTQACAADLHLGPRSSWPRPSTHFVLLPQTVPPAS